MAEPFDYDVPLPPPSVPGSVAWMWMMNTALDLAKLSLVLINALVFMIIVYITQRQKTGENVDKIVKKSDDQNKKRRVGFVIAHPDDEAMFFTPLIQSLSSQPYIELFLICLSTGNFDGLGKVRTKELAKSCHVLSISDSPNSILEITSVQQVAPSKVTIVENDKLQDGMKNKWDETLILEFVEAFVKANDIESIITFDPHGISSHPNHINVHNGVKKFIQKNRNISAWQLITTSLPRKYIGVFDILLCPVLDQNNLIFFSPNPVVSYRAMEAHYSQFVWFRKLFVFFSKYAYTNTLNKIQ
ncbi:N-acetylglucosaminyl-phosphatidylinositol deacetylase [Acrasis kona]|uniref:N-acetylglucosaminylphosphatidylinositol deacetylase n=1 Tax=Acrasis kona TaxID=1008807 RepID=A0AAW2Z982_9EUKA